MVARREIDKLRVWEGVGNRGSDGFGVKVISRAGHNERRGGDALEVVERGKRARVPHSTKDCVARALVNGDDGFGDRLVGGEECLEFRKGFEIALLHLARIGNELEVGGTGGVEPGWTKKDQLFEPLGISKGEIQGNGGAHRKPAKVALLDPKMIHECDDMIREGVKREGLGVKAH